MLSRISHVLADASGKEPACNAETRFWSLGWEDPLEKGMATPSSILAWEIPWTEEPGGLQFMWSQRVGRDWATNTVWMCSWMKANWGPDRLSNLSQSPVSKHWGCHLNADHVVLGFISSAIVQALSCLMAGSPVPWYVLWAVSRLLQPVFDNT